MRRRDFIKAVGGISVGWLPPAYAQHTKTPRVGVLWHAGSAEEESIGLGALTRAFSDLGYVDGKNIALHHRYPAETPERFASLSAELVAIPVDVLVAVTGPAALAAQRATATIPIVFIFVSDPVGSKLVSSFAKPGGNITGQTNITAELTAKRVQLLKEAVPNMKRFTLLVNPNDQTAMYRFIDEAKTTANVLGLDVQVLEVRSQEEFEQAFDSAVGARSEGVITTAGGLFWVARAVIAQLAVQRGLPLIVQAREQIEDGALIAYGPDVTVLFRRAAALVDKILKGARPADLPVEQPTHFELIINMKTAKTLGIDVPPTLLARADEVIE